MDFLLMILLGWMVGWMLSQASDTLPHFSSNLPEEERHPFIWNPPAIVYLFQNSKPRWFYLYLILELVCAGMFGMVVLYFNGTWHMMIILISLSFLLLVTVIDIKYRLVLNIMVYPAVLIVLIFNLVVIRQNTLSMLLGGCLIFSIFYLTAQSGELGSGDVKLATLFGFAFGFPNVLWALLVGVGTGAFMAVYLIFGRQNNRRITIPYAPFLCLGAAVALLYNPFSSLL